MKSLNELKKFELSKKEQLNIKGSEEFCRSVAYHGDVKTFCSESQKLSNSWADVWISFGGADFPQHQT